MIDTTAKRLTARGRSTLITLLAGLALAAGCNGESDAPAAPKATPADSEPRTHGLTREQAAQTLVTVGDTKITLGEFADRLGSQSPYLRARYASPERRREFLDNMVRFELLAMEASKQGHDESASVQRVRKQMMVQRMMSELFEEKGVKLADVTEAEIKKYYEGHREEFTKPAQVRASHIVVKKRALAEKLLTQVKGKPGDMQLFRQLAKEHNTDAETRDRLGDLRFFPAKPSADPAQAVMPDAVRAAAFTLEKTGAIYDKVIETDKGLHVLKLTGKRAKLDRSLEDARRLIQNRLWREKRESAIEGFVAELRKKADVKESPELLAQVKVNLEDEAGKPGQPAPSTPAQPAEKPAAPAAKPAAPAAKPAAPADKPAAAADKPAAAGAAPAADGK